MQPSDSRMTLTELVNQTGFVDLQIRDQEIVKYSDIILHVIDVKQLENIINEMTDNIVLTKTSNKDILQAELLEARTKLLTLIPTEKRHKRGLINAIGTVAKWTIGTIDEEDRQIIQKHLSQTDKAIDGQVQINNHFNLAINQIRNIAKNDRKEIEKIFNSISKIVDEEYQQDMYLQQMTKIQLRESKITHIQDNLVSAKHGIMHPSILTSTEILK